MPMDMQAPSTYVPIDFVANGHASNQEESDRMNDIRKASLELAAEMRATQPIFAELPEAIQPTVAGLVLVGAEPSNFFKNLTSTGINSLFGTIRNPRGGGWMVFEIAASVGAVDDAQTKIRILDMGADGAVLDSIERACEVVGVIQMLCEQDPDVVLGLGEGTLH